MGGLALTLRIVETFFELVRHDSESGNERRFMEHLAVVIGRDLNVVPSFDGFGNLIARIPARESKAAAVILSAHGDTVKPGRGIEPVMDGGVIRSDGETILGADDKAGIAQIIEAVRTASAHPAVEIVVTLGEEVGLAGAKNLDLSLLTARRAFVVDGEHLNEVVIGGPTHVNFDVTVIGKAAHAGMEPEKGISAIRVAAAAIGRMPEGRIDHETTANLGIIEGGLIRNGVPERVRITGECRSLDHAKALRQAATMRAAFETAAADAGATVHIDEEIEYEAMSVPEDSDLVRAAKEAIRGSGLDPVAKRVTGGTDALVLCNRGLDAVVLGYGGKQAHSTDESIDVADLQKGAEIIRRLLESLA
jgi:tripeptide aminopeptidase